MIELEFLEQVGFELNQEDHDVISLKREDSIIQYNRSEDKWVYIYRLSKYRGRFTDVIPYIKESRESFKLWKRSRTIKKVLEND